MLPALIVIGVGFDPTRTLVISQVVLSFGLPFALVPLVLFTSRREIMGGLANGRVALVAAVFATAVIVALNLFLLVRLAMGG
jgi:manganese transport protein